MNNIKMLYLDRVDVSKGTDVNKTSKSKECDKVSTIAINNLSNIAILKIKNANNRCIITGISKT